jgi:hypothetical protein
MIMRGTADDAGPLGGMLQRSRICHNQNHELCTCGCRMADRFATDVPSP